MRRDPQTAPNFSVAKKAIFFTLSGGKVEWDAKRKGDGSTIQITATAILVSFSIVMSGEDELQEVSVAASTIGSSLLAICGGRGVGFDAGESTCSFSCSYRKVGSSTFPCESAFSSCGSGSASLGS